MFALTRHAWKTLRSNFWASLVFDVVVILVVMIAVHSWQIRELPLGQEAPETVLMSLSGEPGNSAISPGRAGVVYFFAPWCGVCRSSIGNLDDLVSDGSIAWASAVALDYESSEEVDAFIEETGVSLPTLMGDYATARDWRVIAFPTYFVIDASGKISSRSVGYSTSLGLRTRVALSGDAAAFVQE